MNHKAVMCLFHNVMVGKQILGDLMLPFSLLCIARTYRELKGRNVERQMVAVANCSAQNPSVPTPKPLIKKLLTPLAIIYFKQLQESCIQIEILRSYTRSHTLPGKTQTI